MKELNKSTQSKPFVQSPSKPQPLALSQTANRQQNHLQKEPSHLKQPSLTTMAELGVKVRTDIKQTLAKGTVHEQIQTQRQKSLDIQSLKSLNIFQYPQIDTQDLQQLFKQRLLLLKKGRVLGRTVIRWALPTKNGKLMYFKDLTASSPQGYFPLYQTNCSTFSLLTTPAVAKALKLAPGVMHIEAVQIKAPNCQNYLVLVPNPTDQASFKVNNSNLLLEICSLSAKGLLERFLSQYNDANICNLLSQRDCSVQSFDWRHDNNNELQNGARLSSVVSHSPSSSQQAQLRHTEQFTDCPNVEFINSTKKVPNILVVNYEKHTHPQGHRSSNRMSITSEPRQKIINDDEVSSEHSCTDNVQQSTCHKKVIRSVNNMKKGATNTSIPDTQARCGEANTPNQSLVVSKNTKTYKTDCQVGVNLSLNKGILNKKTFINQGDQDNLSDCHDEEEDTKDTRVQNKDCSIPVSGNQGPSQCNKAAPSGQSQPSRVDYCEIEEVSDSILEEDYPHQPFPKPEGLKINQYKSARMIGINIQDLDHKNTQSTPLSNERATSQAQLKCLNAIKYIGSNIDRSKLSFNKPIQFKSGQINPGATVHRNYFDDSWTKFQAQGNHLDHAYYIQCEAALRDYSRKQQHSLRDFKVDYRQLTTVEALYQGIEASWNYKFEEATEVFSAFSEKGDVRHQLHQIELNIFKVLITGKKSQIDQCTQKICKYEEALLQTKTSMQRQKQQSITVDHKPHLNMGRPRPKTRFLVSEDINQDVTAELLELITAETHMFKGILKFLSGNKFKAFLIFRECWKIYKKYEHFISKPDNECKENAPKATQDSLWLDADFKSRLLLGLGLFYLGISALPRSLTAIIRIVGFAGNRDKGKMYLQMCINERRCRSTYAALVLCLFYIDQEPHMELVCQTLKQFLTAFPHSALFHWVSSVVSWKLAQLDDAVFFIERALATCPQELSKQAAFLKYEIGWFYYLKQDFQSSIFKFKEVIRDCFNLEYDIEDEEQLQQFNLQTDRDISVLSQNYKSANGFKGHNLKIIGNEEKIVSQSHLSCSDVNSNSLASPKKYKANATQQCSPSQQKGKKHEDFVYLPHKACLTIQLAGSYVALKREDMVVHWLKVTKCLAEKPGITRSKLDQDMGHLATIFIKHRQTNDLLTYEVVYLLHQMPKLPNSILVQIISNITQIMDKVELNLNFEDPSVYKDSPYFADYVSGMLLTIISYCFLGDSDIGALFGQRLVKAVVHLPPQLNYLAVHSLYWVARAYLAENNKKGAECLLLRAKRYKKSEFPIDGKIERVLSDVRASA